ncbi:hypothetical protein [Nitrosopumilus adriaticus]|uniref:ArnR1-like winged helix-turn-helix domain-containing protein n=1 Tax=Nitrosopumilus adriaticus TaxID=1580092 RepID=A0A0D5C1S8_9ARCH|nr:hypothetical protein [Nitrosopumilus adriaticus]AJW70332.1 hypothetical protein NADRNF5_0636 [Nitrosopumilus adriaticus]
MEKKVSVDIKEIDAVSWQVVERILLIFYEQGSLKKSQIAMKSGLKYTTCMRYLKWLNEKMDFIAFELSSDNRQIQSIQLTSQGISFCKNKIFEKYNVDVKKNNGQLFA